MQLICWLQVPSEEKPVGVDVPFLLPHEVIHALSNAGQLQALGLEKLYIYIYIIRASRHYIYIYITFQSFRVRVCWWKLIVLGHPAVCTIHDWTPEQGKYQAILATLCWLGRVGTPSMPAEPWNLWLCHAPIHSFCCDQNVCCFHFPSYIMSLS